MNHSFNIKVAQQYDINCAVLLQNIYYWVEENKSKSSEQHFHDNCYWTYNTVKQFAQRFPYMNERQIRYALDKLEINGLIKTGSFNTSCTRMLWYTVTDKAISILTDKESVQEDFSRAEESDCSTEEKVQSEVQNTERKQEKLQNCQYGVTKLSIRNIQICQNVMTKLSIHTNNKLLYNTTNNIEKEIYKEKETPEQEIFNFWNSKQLIPCTELSNYLETVIATALKSFALQDILLCIDRYSTIVNDREYYFAHKWSLKAFLSQSNAMKDFLDNGEKWINYINRSHKRESNKNNFIHNNYTAEQMSSFITNLDQVEL